MVWESYLLEGLWVTFKLIFFSTILTIPLAAGIAVIRVDPRRWVRVPAWIFVELFRSVPLPVLLFVLYYGLGPNLESVGISPFQMAVFGLVVNEAAYLAENYRGLILSVPIGQWRAAASLGMTRMQAYRLVILPHLRRPAIPHTSNGFVYLVKGSALASLITVPDLAQYAARLMMDTFQPLQVYLTVALIYLAITVPTLYLARVLSRPRRIVHASAAATPDTTTSSPVPNQQEEG